MTERPSGRAPRARRFVRSPMPVLSTALACFLAVLVVLSAKVPNGTSTPLRQTAAVVSRGGKVVLTTTASGRVIETAAPSAGSAGAGPVQTPLVTHASGAAGQGGSDE